MREKDNQEQRLQLAAGRHGLRLVRNRYRASSDGDLYCLRAIWKAAWVVGRRADASLGLMYVQTGREAIASWLTLAEIEQVLANWDQPAPRAWGEPQSVRTGLPYANNRNRGSRVGRGTRRHRLTFGAPSSSLSASSM